MYELRTCNLTTTQFVTYTKLLLFMISQTRHFDFASRFGKRIKFYINHRIPFKYAYA